MIAVILAAGASRRLKNLTNNLPKSLMPIGNTSTLQHQLETIGENNIDKAVIVVGYKREKIVNTIGNKFNEIEIEYVINDIYEKTNTIYSLWLAREYFRNNDFIYFNADVLAHPEIVKKLLNSSHKNTMAVERKRCGEEEVKVMCNSEGRIKRIGKKLNPEECAGEFIGIAKFSKEITQDFITSLEEIINAGGEQSFFERAVDSILDKHEIYIEDISEYPVIEIDFPEDLERARNEIYPRIIEMK